MVLPPTVYGAATKAAGALAGDSSQALNVPGGSASTSTRIYSKTQFPAPGAFTAETWFKTTTTSGGKLLGFGSAQLGNSSRYDRHIYMTNTGALIFGVYNGGIVTLSSAAGVNKRGLAPRRRDPRTRGHRLYVDAALVASNAVTKGESYSGFWRAGGDNLNYWPSAPTSYYWPAPSTRPRSMQRRCQRPLSPITTRSAPPDLVQPAVTPPTPPRRRHPGG